LIVDASSISNQDEQLLRVRVQKRANREANKLPAADSVPPPSHGPRVHRREDGCRIRRSDLYSCRLGVVFVARFCAPPGSSPMKVAVLNKLAPDPLQSRRLPLRLVSDLRVRFPCGIAVAAAAISWWILSSSSAVVVVHVPASLRRLGGVVQERSRLSASLRVSMSAHSRSRRIRCWFCGCWRAALLVSIDKVDWFKWCGDLEELGVIPGRRSPGYVLSPFAADPFRGPQSSSTARKLLRILASWRSIFVSVVGGFWRCLLVACVEVFRGLFVFFPSCWKSSVYSVGSACCFRSVLGVCQRVVLCILP
jgi:hypothetical protein